jgi:hypothetical protein
MKRKADPTGRTLGNKATSRYIGQQLSNTLRQEITTHDQLERTIRVYDQIEPHLSQDQRFYLSTQFAAHQEHLGSRPTPTETQTQHQADQTALNIRLSRPVSTEEADPFNIEVPTAVGHRDSRPRARMRAEETIDWSLFDNLPGQPPPPPPPPPSGGGSGNAIPI